MFIPIVSIFLFLNVVTQAQVCTPNVCNQHGTCIPIGMNSFTCHCDSGFVGETCNEELNECASNPCANNGTCMDLENGFLCQCASGWNGTFCTESKTISKRKFIRLDPCQSSPCGPVGKCISTNQPQIPYYCQCPDGQNTMFKCTNPNPCEPNPCGPGTCQITTNLLNGYICRCNDGTVQITNCSEAKSPCESLPCGPQGRCLPLAATPKGYVCICQDGAITFTTPESCPITKASCTDMSCKNGGTCVPYSANEPSCSANQEDSTCCQCLPNFTGPRCEIQIDFCSANPCSPHGRCLSGKSGYRCQCFEGYTGENCEVQIVSSGCLSNPCTIGICYQLNKNGPAYVCICPDGTLSLACNSTNTTRNPFALPTIPPLATTPMASLVYHNHGKYGGHVGNNMAPQMSTCNPSARDVCNSGQCILVGRSLYTCRCRDGYTGTHCETNINECASNPCLGGGTCYDLINAFACLCPDRIFRPQCNVTGAPAISKGTSVLMATSNHKVSHVYPDRLAQTDCQCRNGGLCLINPNGMKMCRCLNGFTGAFCESTVSENRGLSPSQAACAQNLCQNGGTCQQQGLTAICVCKPGFTGQRCESEYFRCQANGRFADASSCKQGRYFECVYFGQYDLGLPNGVLYSRSCPPGLWFNALNDRCDYPSAVRC